MRFVFVLLVLPISLLCFDIKHHCGEYSGYQPLPDEFIDKSTHSTTNLDRCELIQMQYISRHGERFPFGGMVGKFERIHQKFQSLPSNADIPDFIKSWTPALFTYQSVFEDATAKGLNELYDSQKELNTTTPRLPGYWTGKVLQIILRSTQLPVTRIFLIGITIFIDFRVHNLFTQREALKHLRMGYLKAMDLSGTTIHFCHFMLNPRAK